jgi:hypothetical protein
VRLGASSWCRNRCPCLPLAEPLPPNCITEPLQNLHVEMTSLTLPRRYELMAHQTVHVKEFQKFFTHPRPLNMSYVLTVNYNTFCFATIDKVFFKAWHHRHVICTSRTI